MRGLCSRQVMKNIEGIGAGRVFSWRDVQVEKFSSDAVRRVLSRLENESKIKRRGRGLYYVPVSTLVGPGRISDEALLSKLLIEKRARDFSAFGNERVQINRLIPVGASLFYEIGLTTQVPARKTFIAPISFPGSRTLKVSMVPMEKYQYLSNAEVKAYLALVDLDRVGNESVSEVARSYARYIQTESISPKRLREICIIFGGKKGRRGLTNIEFVESVVWPKS